MTFSVQMRIDVRAMPHSFLSVTHPDGTITEYGLVPAIEGSPFNAGKIDITQQRRETDFGGGYWRLERHRQQSS